MFRYLDCLKNCEKEELEQPYDIILCTCNETCSRRLLQALQIHAGINKADKEPLIAQCIVDECGMATEPETLAAISKCQHAVLIGDHKQLQPVVKYREAKECGLSRSLFERYAERRDFDDTPYDDTPHDADTLVTLDIQYRMVCLVCFLC